MVHLQLLEPSVVTKIQTNPTYIFVDIIVYLRNSKDGNKDNKNSKASHI